MREQNFNVLCSKPYVYCKVFEENSGALKLARLPKLHPRTKHINLCYHHFCKHVRKRLIKIFPVDTKTILLMRSPSPWHKMTFNLTVAICVASNLSKPSKWGSVTYDVEYFGTYLGYFPQILGPRWIPDIPRRNWYVSV